MYKRGKRYKRQSPLCLIYITKKLLLSFKTDFRKVDQHTGGKWLIHGTKHHKDNQSQSPEHPCKIA